MFCLNCGKELADGAVFCGNCGHRVEPSAPPVQETVIVPEIPVEAPVEAPSTMDRPTVIVPEVPELPQIPLDMGPDPIAQMYPDKPEEPEKKSKVGLIIGLVAAAILLISIVVVVVLGVANDWWRTAPSDKDGDNNSDATSSSTTAPEDPEPEKEPTAQELRAELKKYSAGGLHLYLSRDFDKDDEDEDGAYFETRDVDLTVTWGPLEDVKNSAEFARLYKKSLDGDFESLESDKKFGITYMVVTYDEDDVAVLGFYVQDDYGWIIEAVTDEYDELGEDLINYVTLAEIDEDFVPPKDSQTEVQVVEKDFAGLYLTMNSTFEVVDFDEYAYFTAEGMEICVQLTSLTAQGVTSSQEFANAYAKTMEAMDWETLEVKSKDNSFYYVLMISDSKLVNVVGLYAHGDTAWVVTGETRDYDNDTELLTDYVTSGRIVPEEIPVTEALTSVTLNGLTLELPKGYRETFRGEYIIVTNGVREIYIFTGKLTDDSTATDLAKAEYDNNLHLWDNVRLYTTNNVECLMYWDNDADTTTTAYGYYVAEGNWWSIQVRQEGLPDEDELLAIVTAGVVDPSAIQGGSTQQGELVQRERVEHTGFVTAEYEGLQISYGSGWQVDDTWGPTGDYTSDWFDMVTYRSSLKDTGISDAVNYAWMIAENQRHVWDNCEVGIAGDVPYVLLYDDDSQEFLVFGTYANGQYAWEIAITCRDKAMTDLAIWYATAGVIL